MRLIISLTILSLCLSASLAVKDLLASHLWQQFKDAHEKTYESKELEDYRFGLFKKNLALIEQHNRDYTLGKYTYTLGVNQFADWTVDEFRATMLGTRFANITRSRNARVATFMRMPEHVKLAESVDWREEGAVTPVKNQGQCGSCWAFSTTGSLEGAHFRLTNKMVSLSEQQLVDCSAKFHNNGCNGGLMDNAFEYVKSVGGLDTEDSYPYHGKQEKCHFKKESVGSTCAGYVDIPSGDEDALKEAVATAGPVSVAIDVTEERFMLYKDGVFVDETCSNEEDSLNHGVLVVGYAGSSDNQEGKSTGDYWIVKNSWGTTWGEKGYIRMARNKKNMCGIATAASYPLVKDD